MLNAIPRVRYVHCLVAAIVLGGCRSSTPSAPVPVVDLIREFGAADEGELSRFRSSLVQTERYVLGCYRYIELNPVRPNMVKHPAEYPWSSYAANADGKSVPWLTPHGEYLALGSDDAKRQAAYRGLFATELDPELLREIRVSTHGGYAVGSSRFREDIERALKQRATPRGPGRPIRSSRAGLV